MIRRFIGRVFAVIGFLVVVLVAAGGALWLYLVAQREAVPSLTVLELDLEAGVVETRGGDSLLGYAAARPTLVELVETLRRAGDDERVKGLIAKVGTAGGMGYGQVQETRDAVRAFRDSGKFAIAYADSFREFGPGTKAYYLATAFDEIWLQPSGNVGLTGLIAEQPFLREALEEFEIRPQLERRYEYKTAFNLATEAGFTEAHRESTQAMIDSLFRQIVDGIAEGRGLDPQSVRQLVDNGPHLGDEAFQAGLIDGLAYRDQVYERARDKAGEAESATVLELGKYQARLDPPETEHAIALIHGVGLVTRGKGRAGPILGGVFVGADTVAKALRDAVEDDDIEAIVLRLDSGGGR
ncbi:MAG: S49 family peptidase, partial [Kiloniellales bacterium]